MLYHTCYLDTDTQACPLTHPQDSAAVDILKQTRQIDIHTPRGSPKVSCRIVTSSSFWTIFFHSLFSWCLSSITFNHLNGWTHQCTTMYAGILSGFCFSFCTVIRKSELSLSSFACICGVQECQVISLSVLCTGNFPQRSFFCHLTWMFNQYVVVFIFPDVGCHGLERIHLHCFSWDHKLDLHICRLDKGSLHKDRIGRSQFTTLVSGLIRHNSNLWLYW